MDEKITDLIFGIFDAISTKAIEQDYSVTLRYDTSLRKSKTIVSDSNVNENALTLSAYPFRDKEDDLNGSDEIVDQEVTDEDA